MSAVGSGLTLPFAVIYLHDIRGLPLVVAGAAVSTIALSGFVGNPLGGWLADRVGPRRTVALGACLAAAGSVAIALVHDASQAFPAFALFGLGVCILTPAQDSLLAVVVSAEERSSVFSVRHATLNAGLAVGALAAAAIVHHATPPRFQTLFVLDGLTFLAMLPILGLLGCAGDRVNTGEVDRAEDAGATRRGGIRIVLGDVALRRVLVLTAGLFALGFTQFSTSLPAYATRPGGIPPGDIGFVFAANTLAVVVLQLPVLHLLAGRRRTSSIAWTCTAWAIAWLLVLGTGSAGRGATAVALFVAVAVVFGLGETLLSPALWPIVNDLATDDLRGRYNGVHTLALTTGTAIGPVLGGALLGGGHARLLFAGLAVGCAVLGVLSIRLAPRLPGDANTIGDLSDEEPVDRLAVAVAADVP